MRFLSGNHKMPFSGGGQNRTTSTFLGHSHGFRHKQSQMRYFSSTKFKRQALNASANATWRLARNNLLTK